MEALAECLELKFAHKASLSIYKSYTSKMFKDGIKYDFPMLGTG